jgi:hypothetical protein
MSTFDLKELPVGAMSAGTEGSHKELKAIPGES